MADLSNLKNNIKETVVVQLKIQDTVILNDPAKGEKEGTPMSITLNTPNSKASRDAEFSMQDEAISEYKEDPTASTDIDARKMFDIRVKKVARNTVAWDITDGGIKPELSLDRAVQFYNDFPMFLYLAEEALQLESGFTLA